jgi:MFS family permease
MAVLLVVSAIATGYGGSVLWVAQGKYISTCSNEINKGLFMSIFWAFYVFSLISGNLLSAFLIIVLPYSTFYMILVAMCFCTAAFFSLLPTPTKEEDLEGLKEPLANKSGESSLPPPTTVGNTSMDDPKYVNRDSDTRSSYNKGLNVSKS